MLPPWNPNPFGLEGYQLFSHVRLGICSGLEATPLSRQGSCSAGWVAKGNESCRFLCCRLLLQKFGSRRMVEAE
jgi:hypothetical protein